MTFAVSDECRRRLSLGARFSSKSSTMAGQTRGERRCGAWRELALIPAGATAVGRSALAPPARHARAACEFRCRASTGFPGAPWFVGSSTRLRAVRGQVTRSSRASCSATAFSEEIAVQRWPAWHRRRAICGAHRWDIRHGYEVPPAQVTGTRAARCVRGGRRSGYGRQRRDATPALAEASGVFPARATSFDKLRTALVSIPAALVQIETPPPVRPPDKRKRQTAALACGIVSRLSPIWSRPSPPRRVSASGAGVDEDEERRVIAERS